MPILVTFEEIRAAGEQDWRLDNTALKTIRSQGEVPQFLHWSGVDLTHSDPFPVLRVRRGKGPAFSMVEPQQQWSWRKMLNRFDDATLKRIIGSGVAGILCQPMSIPGASTVRFADVWVFVIHRGDGEAVRLYPNPNQTDGHMMCVPIPTAADGPETHTEVVPATNADTRGDWADWRVWQDWRGAWSSDGADSDGAWHDWSAWSNDGAWHDWSRDASTDTWRGAWNNDGA